MHVALWQRCAVTDLRARPVRRAMPLALLLITCTFLAPLSLPRFSWPITDEQLNIVKPQFQGDFPPVYTVWWSEVTVDFHVSSHSNNTRWFTKRWVTDKHDKSAGSNVSAAAKYRKRSNAAVIIQRSRVSLHLCLCMSLWTKFKRWKSPLPPTLQKCSYWTLGNGSRHLTI